MAKAPQVGPVRERWLGDVVAPTGLPARHTGKVLGTGEGRALRVRGLAVGYISFRFNPGCNGAKRDQARFRPRSRPRTRPSRGRGRHSPPDGRVRLADERAAVGTTVQLGSSLQLMSEFQITAGLSACIACAIALGLCVRYVPEWHRRGRLEKSARLPGSAELARARSRNCADGRRNRRMCTTGLEREPSGLFGDRLFPGNAG